MIDCWWFLGIAIKLEFVLYGDLHYLWMKNWMVFLPKFKSNLLVYRLFLIDRAKNEFYLVN